MLLSVVIRHAVKQMRVVALLYHSVFDNVLDFVAYLSASDGECCTEYRTGSLCYLSNTLMTSDGLVYRRVLGSRKAEKASLQPGEYVVLKVSTWKTWRPELPLQMQHLFGEYKGKSGSCGCNYNSPDTRLEPTISQVASQMCLGWKLPGVLTASFPSH